MEILTKIYEDAKQNPFITIVVFICGVGVGAFGYSKILDNFGIDRISKNSYLTIDKINENYVEKSEFTKLKESVNNSTVLNSKLLQAENALNEGKRVLEKCQIQNNQLSNESQLLNTKISNFNQQSQLEEQKKEIYREIRRLSRFSDFDNGISPANQKQIEIYIKEADQIQAQILNLMNQNIKQ
ncbi:hypothetical protein FA592_05910 [Sulfurospirillum diekertiae]|jgi:predicted nuclease with TOPRIM domain|uniref:Uncharacterized protein n=1 Tax=Sulfurospirillum diekertiae TaxID=1854492 RepID=A0A6G9VTU0_9BACT|nr:hypothetical protein [Sulfurospirillum diekertiae]QIR75789.1 hypothetical protein FA584_06010 [Sulfurospirillum diekertiae]QIR78434.1 hypothetical protein FA592_05910 [Sulfurospirillum diekertiae]